MTTVSLLGAPPAITVGKILCVGRNYRAHAKEMNAEVPTAPVLFLKPASAVIGSGSSVVIPDISTDMHHEVELTVLIGTWGKAIPPSRALDHVAGYGVGLDMTLRDVQAQAKKSGLPWALAKGFDTSAPVSPFVPASRVPDASKLGVRLRVNGEERQKGWTRDFIFPLAELLGYVSRYFTLEPGDILFTGTPEGVGRVSPGDRLDAFLIDEQESALASLSVTIDGAPAP